MPANEHPALRAAREIDQKCGLAGMIGDSKSVTRIRAAAIIRSCYEERDGVVKEALDAASVTLDRYPDHPRAMEALVKVRAALTAMEEK